MSYSTQLKLFRFYYFDSDVLNTVCMTSFCGLAYFAVIICRFLQWSLELSTLENRQIECIENQQIAVKHKIILLTQEKQKMDKQSDEKIPAVKEATDVKEEEIEPKTSNSETDKMRDITNKIEEYVHINNYLDDVIKNICKTSVSPKIAGLSLDKAFVKLAISSFVAFVSFGATYYIKNKL